MNPLILAILLILAFLGLLVFVRIAYTAGKVARAKFRNPLRKFQGPVIPLLDQPIPCPTCARLEFVRVARADFREMPFVEHFVCHACGTQYLGENQEKMVNKRLEARRKFAATLTGRAKDPETKPGN